MSTISFCYAGLKAGVSSDWLNPSRGSGTYDSNPIRILARLVYACACTIFLPIPGVIYHSAAATYNAVWLNDKEAAEKHFLAFLGDTLFTVALGALTIVVIALRWGQQTAYIESRRIEEKEFQVLLVALIPIAVPIAYSIYPDFF